MNDDGRVMVEISIMELIGKGVLIAYAGPRQTNKETNFIATTGSIFDKIELVSSIWRKVSQPSVSNFLHVLILWASFWFSIVNVLRVGLVNHLNSLGDGGGF
jgi:hypothetical protein